MMLKLLKQYINDHTIAGLLTDRSKWDSLIVNRRKPHTYRVFTYFGNNRICLHRFDPCDRHESFDHPHPWPGAFLLLKGSYRMKIGHSPDRISPPVPVADFVLHAGSAYEISDPLTWHSVTPLETTYTLMLNGPTWGPEVAHKDVRTTKGKDLDKMPEDELLAHLNIFAELENDLFNSGIWSGTGTLQLYKRPKQGKTIDIRV